MELLLEGRFGYLLARHPHGERLQPRLRLVDHHHRRTFFPAESFLHHETDLPSADLNHPG